jgi:hypothetical protein
MADQISPLFLMSLETRLELLAVAEAEVGRAAELFPARRPLLVRAGGSITQPVGLLAQAPPWLFRAHCRELLERLAEAGDTSAATVAELATALGCVNHHAPPSPAARALEALLFLRAAELGEADLEEGERRSLETDRAAADPFQAEDLLKTLARRLADPTRRPRRARGARRLVQLEFSVAA